ncbi:hypothetical protein J7E62_31115 [Variovorax paradoxus]|nr:hypothetical protein [Variovorax paradoxus]
MTNDDTYYDELLPAESGWIAERSASEPALIDAALLSQVSNYWRKVARVVGVAMLWMPNRPIGVRDVFFAARVALLVEAGHLECQGDPRRMRSSEVRLKSSR